MSRPIIAIIGRPNVGKSSLFNRLIGKRQAIVSQSAGTTRDRLYSMINIDNMAADLVDTAGLSADLGTDQLGIDIMGQIQQAVAEANILIYVLDANSGMTQEDQEITKIIRKGQTPTLVFINKVDDPQKTNYSLFTNLGLGSTIIGSVTQKRGIAELKQALVKQLKVPGSKTPRGLSINELPKVALVGRPNVGKSTLFNAIVREKRVLVSDIPGTTRDTIDSQVKLSNDMQFTLLDTAGLRRRGKVGRATKIEQYSVLRTLRAIDQANLIILVVDANEGMTRGDAHIATYATEQGKRLITVVNKIDLTRPENFNPYRFPFISKQPMVFLSAQNGEINELLGHIQKALRNLGDGQNRNPLPEK